MAFYGKYGDLPTLEAAKLSLLDIAENVDKEMFFRIDDQSLTNVERYDLGRLHRTVLGLQMVIWKNGGVIPATWLPQLFKWKEYRDSKMR